MNKLDMLYIRACRTWDPVKRLESIRRRFYYTPKRDWDFYNSVELGELVDKYNIMSIQDLQRALHPGSQWRYEKYPGETIKFDQLMCRIYTSAIRNASIKKFGEDFISPKRFG